jgi:5-methylcytosine-specific restriction endonuclease McrA
MIRAETRRLVRSRAGNRCEYCHTNQDEEPFLRYQVEHIIAVQHGGSDDDNNLALACSHCNLHKGPNLTGIDPLTGTIEPLFHPRRQQWSEHFVSHGPVLIGITAIGRTTIRVLDINNPVRLDLRRGTFAE